MARPMRFSRTRAAPRTAAATRVATFVAAAIGPIDWAAWWSNEDYRTYTNLQVFASGMAAYAGRPPTVQAATAGMDAVFTFVMGNATWPPPNGAGEDPKAEAAAEAAVEAARVLYEEQVIDNVLPALVAKWAKRIGVAQLSPGPAALAARRS